MAIQGETDDATTVSKSGALTAHGVLVGAGGSAIVATSAGTSGQVLTSNGVAADPTFQTPSVASGDFVGPGSATDNAVVRFDATTGKLGQNSLVTIDDSGNVTTPCLTISDSGAVTTLTNPDTDGVIVAAVSKSGGSGYFEVSRQDIAGRFVRVNPNGVNAVVSSAGFTLQTDNTAGTSPVVLWASAFISRLGNTSSYAGWTVTANGVQKANGSSDGSTVGAILSSVLVEANTAGSGSPNVLAAAETRTLLTNEGATAENYHTLPSAAAGYTFTFYCQDTDGVRVVANTGDTIRLGGAASGTAGFVRSAVAGSCVTLVAINATEWVATSIVGTWTVDV